MSTEPMLKDREKKAWDFARSRTRFTRSQLQAESDLTPGRFRLFWVRMLEHGHIRRDGHESRTRFYTALDREEAVVVSAEQRMSPEGRYWQVMRVMRIFRPADLLLGLGDLAEPEEAGAIQAYCKHLVNSGYLTVLEHAIPKKREARYRLVRNTGPLPPIRKRLWVTIDQNDDRIVFAGGERV